MWCQSFFHNASSHQTSNKFNEPLVCDTISSKLLYLSLVQSAKEVLKISFAYVTNLLLSYCRMQISNSMMVLQFGLPPYEQEKKYLDKYRYNPNIILDNKKCNNIVEEKNRGKYCEGPYMSYPPNYHFTINCRN
jgi:hypothetical protein